MGASGQCIVSDISAMVNNSAEMARFVFFVQDS